MSKYLAVLYKPDSDDYCRGCLMASYSSNFETLLSDDKEEVIDFISNRLSDELGGGEDEYEYQLYNFDSEGIQEFYDFDLEVADETERKIKVVKEMKKKQEEINKQERIAANKARELEQLARLQEKYNEQ